MWYNAFGGGNYETDESTFKCVRVAYYYPNKCTISYNETLYDDSSRVA